jgi:hypothetical protein
MLLLALCNCVVYEPNVAELRCTDVDAVLSRSNLHFAFLLCELFKQNILWAISFAFISIYIPLT